MGISRTKYVFIGVSLSRQYHPKYVFIFIRFTTITHYKTRIQRRNLLRLTAKSTQFGKKTFTSWLIESAGTLPLQRRKDTVDGQADNSNVIRHLLEVIMRIRILAHFPTDYYPSEGIGWR
jgi:hypothetical protein